MEMSHVLFYVREVRQRLIKALIYSAPILIVCCLYSNKLYHLLSVPLLKSLPAGRTLIATQVAAPFIVPLKLSIITGLFIAAPIWLNQIWRFMMPALFRHERKFIWLLLFVSSALFYLGVLFAYFTVMPLVLRFFVHTAPSIIEVKPDMAQYLDFSLKLLMAFGVAFEVPVITVIAIRFGITTRESLSKKRPFIVVAAFILGMLMTPPDIISQLLMALPLWLLFEAGLFMSRYFTPAAEDHQATSE